MFVGSGRDICWEHRSRYNVCSGLIFRVDTVFANELFSTKRVCTTAQLLLRTIDSGILSPPFAQQRFQCCRAFFLLPAATHVTQCAPGGASGSCGPGCPFLLHLWFTAFESVESGAPHPVHACRYILPNRPHEASFIEFCGRGGCCRGGGRSLHGRHCHTCVAVLFESRASCWRVRRCAAEAACSCVSVSGYTFDVDNVHAHACGSNVEVEAVRCPVD